MKKKSPDEALGVVRAPKSSLPEYRLTLPDGSEIQLRSEKAQQLALSFALPKDCPTVEEFGPLSLLEAKAERRKPSYVEGKRIILVAHIYPVLGDLRLDAIGHREIVRLKASLNEKKLGAKTVNNILSVLRKLLKTSKTHGLIDVVPEILAVKAMTPDFEFFTFDEWDKVLSVAEGLGPEALAVSLLGGHAGLRRGEILGLQWGDLDFAGRTLRVQRSVWQGYVHAPKSNKIRSVPMTSALTAAVQGLPNRGPWVLSKDDGSRLTVDVIREWAAKLAEACGMPKAKRLHVFRHTFCSHLAMRGAPTISIKELAGHARLDTTQRYMHVQEDAKANAISLLEKKEAPGSDSGGPVLTHRERTGVIPRELTHNLTLRGFEPRVKENLSSPSGTTSAGFIYVNPDTSHGQPPEDGRRDKKKTKKR